MKIYKFSIPFLGVALSLTFAASVVLAAGLSWFQGFETDTTGWSGVTRASSGTHSILSATGGWHAESSGGGLNASGASTNWGGYNSSFPENGYVTSVDVWLEAESETFTSDTRFDFSSAINSPAGSHRRDFVFNAGFYNDSDTTGAGPRFVISASNNATRSGAYPKNPAKDPFTVITDGWYTFEHTFRNDAGILVVDLKIKDEAGVVMHTWTLTDSTDTINGTVGGNRYGWFALQELPILAFDNSSKSDILSTPADKEQCKKDGWRQLVNGSGDVFTNQGKCVKFVTTGN